MARQPPPEARSRARVLQVGEWQRHAAAGYTEVWLPGAGHGYAADPPAALLDAVRAALLLRAPAAAM
jgi:pimeloyl-ACP methyl ester carboxylesterase